MAFGSAGRSPTVTLIDWAFPSRRISNLFCVFAISLATRRVVEVESVTFWPLTDRMMSLRFRPARSAGLPVVTSAIRAPLTSSMPSASANSGVRSPIWTPSQPRETRPFWIRVSVTSFASSAGMAKPMPTDPPVGDRICEFTPITLPLRSKVGPPELPRLIGASICRKSVYGLPAPSSRPSADRMPALAEPPRPNGLPSATTQSPLRMSFEVPNFT